ncbi:MAG: serine/threonine-protein phosphatase [Deltaproteobacteria bacterium]|jgi:hypothetical protein|nr:serine/threonine-protein phosphatase [Deltaproteobacteria bacterium]
MHRFCTEIGYQSLNKFGEILCGDMVEVVEKENREVIIVLADGLGSGVKACILSNLTAKIIATMLAADLSITDCVQAIAATLPVCAVRKIAYSTFTIIRIVDYREAEIIRYDNPNVIFLRDGVATPLQEWSETIDGKVIYKSHVKLQENDTFIAVSDGAVHAGVGKTLNFGWQLKDITSFLESIYQSHYTAKTLSTILLEKCNALYGGEPGDDTSVCTLKIRLRKPMNLLLGPPQDPADVQRMMSLFFSKAGKHIVCGGTTSTLAAEYLGKPLHADISDYVDPSIPPTATVEGIDLVTEGVLTISRVLEYARDYLADNKHYKEWSQKKDGASQIARLLFEEATDISFYVGQAVNPAHQNPNLPIGFNIKMRLVEELSESLKKMGKKIKVSYF